MVRAAFARAMPPRLRNATEADLATLVRHRDAMWVEMGRVAPGDHDPTSAAYGDWLLARMQRGTLKAFIVEEADGKAVTSHARKGPRPDPRLLASGGVWVQEVQPRPGHPQTMWGYILSVYTEPNARRRGLARVIVQACIDWAKEQGCTRACLHASEEARPLYEDLGFETTAEMWLDLRPPGQRPKRGTPAKGPSTPKHVVPPGKRAQHS